MYHLSDDPEITKKIDEARKELFDSIFPIEIFVVCENRSQAIRLMDEYLRIANISESAKVSRARLEIRTKYEIGRFIIKDQLYLIEKGHRKARFTWADDFERNLRNYEEQKLKGEKI